LYEGVSIRECRLCYARRRGAPCRGRVWIVRVRDEVLLKRVASWGERALSDLYDHYASLVYGTGMRLPGDTGPTPLEPSRAASTWLPCSAEVLTPFEPGHQAAGSPGPPE
jgi:hypothetical protein